MLIRTLDEVRATNRSVVSGGWKSAQLLLKGTGTVGNLGIGETHELSAGTLYALNEHDRHVVRPRTDILRFARSTRRSTDRKP